MKRLLHIIPLMLFFLSGCVTEKEERPQEEPEMKGYAELIQAYQDGKVFVSAVHSSGSCLLTFDGGYTITVPETSFKVYDCTDSLPETVSTRSATRQDFLCIWERSGTTPTSGRRLSAVR